jgi:hypothetical protein
VKTGCALSLAALVTAGLGSAGWQIWGREGRPVTSGKRLSASVALEAGAAEADGIAMGDVPADRLGRRVARERGRPGDRDRLAALERGLEGERNDGESLRRRLSGLGVCVEHSVRLFGWGDIDHLTVGPGGVTLIDSKAWTGVVSVVGGVPRVGSWSKRSELAKVARQVTAVRIVLSRCGPGGVGVPVVGILCLAGDEQRPLVELEGGLKLAGAAAAAEIANRPGSRGRSDAAELMRVLVRELPRVSRKEVDELGALTGDVAAGGMPEPAGWASPRPPGSSRPSRARTRPAARTRRDHPRRAQSARSRERSGSRRRKVHTIELLPGLVALGLLIAAVSYLSGLPRVPAQPVTGLALSRANGHATVRFRAAAGERLAITLVAGTQAHRRMIIATGKPQHWEVRHLGSGSQTLSASVCVSDIRGLCISPAETTSLSAR